MRKDDGKVTRTTRAKSENGAEKPSGTEKKKAAEARSFPVKLSREALEKAAKKALEEQKAAAGKALEDDPELAQKVLEANLRLASTGLAPLTWGNVSQRDKSGKYMLIKPSGVPYDTMTTEDLVLVEIESGCVVWGTRRPSSDTDTHLALYRAYPDVKAIVHTHSKFATVFAQLKRDIPAFGTTHADHFYGPVPCTRPLTEEEINGDYEANTGKVIIECFAGKDPMAVPAVLVGSHGPFTWGKDAKTAVDNSVALEACAEMAWHVLALSPEQPPVDQFLLDKHYFRKHGPNAYYGQKEK